MNPLAGLPPWATEAVFVLIGGIQRLLNAGTDDEREAVLMEAAEGIKAALDKKKFG